MFDIENYRHLIIGVTNDIRACAYIRPYISHVKLRTDCVNCFGKRYRENRNFRSVGTDGVMTDISPLLRTNRKPQFIATVFTPITKRLSVFYCICGILIAAIVVGQLDLVNSFGEADRESYINRATAVTCISPLH